MGKSTEDLISVAFIFVLDATHIIFLTVCWEIFWLRGLNGFC